MNIRQLWTFAAVAALAALLSGLAYVPAAASLPQQTNLLANGGLDSFSGGTATSWLPWWETVQNPGSGSLDYVVQPDFVPETNPALVHSGSGSQHIGRAWDPWHAGIRQTINVPAGSTVRITAYARARASGESFPAPSDSAVQSRVRIGAEPNGSIEWFSGTVVWSGMANPHDTWVPITLDVTAGASGKVTIFLSANFRGDSRLHLDVWWDNVSAVIVGAQPAPTNTSAPGVVQPTSAPQPTTGGGTAAQPTSPPAAGGFQMPTPGADGVVIYTVQAGDTLWAISAQSGISVDEIKSLNNMTTDIISVGQQLVLARGAPTVPEATEEPTSDPNAEPTSQPADTQAAPENTAAAPTDPMEEQPTGIVCALLWNDINGNGVRDTNETMLAGGQLTIVDIATGAPVNSYTTDGISEPHCFQDLPAGRYTISSAAPANYTGTTPSATALEVEGGTTSILEFGAQASAAAAAATPGSSSDVLRTALFGAGGIVFLLLAAGMAAFLFLRRAR